mmetsp:Transcript_3795/g.8662  ORF Transcript_3795/g.8662 Transcript_3795/m.8662 type:complete len:243 (+) Transcript_3795:326-1054(+)
MAARLPARKSSGAAANSFCESRNGRTAACGQMRLHLLHCVHLSMSTRGTLMAMPRFSYWLVPKGTRPPGSKVLTGSELPSMLLQGRWMLFAKLAALDNHAGASNFGGGAPTGASAQEAGTLISTMPSQLMFTPSMFICTTLSPFFPYIFLIDPFKSSIAASKGITPLNLKKTLCMIMLMRLPKPAFTPIFVASMRYNFAPFFAKSDRIFAGSFASNSDSCQVQLITHTPPFLRYLVTSYCCA